MVILKERNNYDLLEVRTDHDLQLIKRGYRRLARHYNPKATKMFKGTFMKIYDAGEKRAI